MKTFAQINASGVCVAVLQSAGEVDNPQLIALDGEGFDLGKLGQRWTGKAWEQVAPTAKEIAALELMKIDQQTGMNRTMRETLIALADKTGTDVAFLKAKEAAAVTWRGKLRG